MKFNSMRIYNKNSYTLEDIDNNSIEALITDPPYGISYQNHYWDKDLPKKRFGKISLRNLKLVGFGLFLV